MGITCENDVQNGPTYQKLLLKRIIEENIGSFLWILALAYLTMATVTSAVVDMIMSLVIVHENKKLIIRQLNIVHSVEFNADGKGWALYETVGVEEFQKWVSCFFVEYWSAETLYLTENQNDLLKYVIIKIIWMYVKHESLAQKISILCQLWSLFHLN